MVRILLVTWYARDRDMLIIISFTFVYWAYNSPSLFVKKQEETPFRATKEVDIGLHPLLPSNLPIVVDVFCRQVIRRAGPVGKFFMWARRSCYNISLVPGIYIYVIVRWPIHASIVSYLPQNEKTLLFW